MDSVCESSVIQIYIAVSLDGYVATDDGGISWINPYNSEDYGYQPFLESIDTIVMGRRTYEQLLRLRSWPYRGKRVVVLSSRQVENPPALVEVRGGEVTDIAAELRLTGNQIWLAGGSSTLRPFLDAGLVDRLELFIIPVMLGCGIRLFDPSPRFERLELQDCRTYGNGVVQLMYLIPR